MTSRASMKVSMELVWSMKVLLWHEHRKIIKLFIIGLDILTQ